MPNRGSGKLHRLLERQIRRHLAGVDLDGLSGQLASFITAIDQAYRAADEDRLMIERSMELSSAELIEAKEKAEAAMHTRQMFMANMSHEIRTPMNGVIGMAELLIETKLDAVQLDYVNTIRTSANSLLTVINDILDFSKIEAGKFKITPVVFDLRERLSQIEAMFNPKLKAGDLLLILEVAKSIPKYLFADGDRLSQVLINLIGNSVKFTPAGGAIVVIVEEQLRTDKYITLHFHVIDTGVGIPKLDQERVFAPFTQLDGSNSRNFGGTGLGLTISAHLVERMSGKFNIRSEPGLGSVFSFNVEVGLLSDQQTLQKASHVLNEDCEKQRPLRILVAEDNPINQKLIRKLLENSGHQVVLASNGLQAVELFKGGTFELILMDIQMPEMDGVAATETIRKIEAGQSKQIPIIAVTAHAMQGDRERYIEIGMNDYISKPIDRRILASAILRQTKSIAK